MRRVTPWFLALVIATSGCALLLPKPKPQHHRRPRPVVTAENRFVLMPYGRYLGRSGRGSAELILGQDQKFFLRFDWAEYGRPHEGQWTGTFEWLKRNGFETIAFYDVVEGVDARRTFMGTRDVESAILHLDRQRHEFAFDVPHLGTVDFAPAR